MSDMFKVAGEEGGEGMEDGSHSKRLKPSPEVEGLEDNADDTITYKFPKKASIHQHLRCVLLEYILSPAFLAYGPPANFQYYPVCEKWVSPEFDMAKYDPTQFRAPVAMPNPTGAVNAYLFNLTCDVRRLNNPEITHVQCCILTRASIVLNTWSWTQVVKFSVYPVNLYRHNVQYILKNPNPQHMNDNLPPEGIQLNVTIEEMGLWADENGACPRIQNTSDWPSLVSFVQQAVKKAFDNNGKHVNKLSGGRGYYEGGLSVI